jgi:hypothetical protein
MHSPNGPTVPTPPRWPAQRGPRVAQRWSQYAKARSVNRPCGGGGESRTPRHRLVHPRPKGCERSDLRSERTSGDAPAHCCPRFTRALRIQRGPIGSPVPPVVTPSALRSSATRDRIGRRARQGRSKPSQATPCSQTQIERDRHLRRQGPPQVRASVVFTVAVRRVPSVYRWLVVPC